MNWKERVVVEGKREYEREDNKQKDKENIIGKKNIGEEGEIMVEREKNECKKMVIEQLG